MKFDLTWFPLTSQDDSFCNTFTFFSDKARIDSLVKLNVAALTGEVAKNIFLEIVSFPVQGVCKSLKRVGGSWYGFAVDGDKFICLDDKRIWDGSGR